MQKFHLLTSLKEHCEPMFLHSVRVASAAKIIADSLSLGREISQQCFESGLMHDIGKIMIPQRLLMTTSKMDKYAYEKVKLHVRFGIDMLHNTAPQHEKDSVSFHHERYDGNGYPYGIKGEEIPLNVRIVSVADAFDAMTSNRPHQPNLSIEMALIEVKNNSGTQFCPIAVDGLLKGIDAIKHAKLRLENGTSECLLREPLKSLYFDRNSNCRVVEEGQETPLKEAISF